MCYWEMHRKSQTCALPGDHFTPSKKKEKFTFILIWGDHVGIKISGLPADNMPEVGFVMSILNEKGDDHPPKEVEAFKALVYVQDHPGQLKSRSGIESDVKQGFTPIVHVRTAKNPCRNTSIFTEASKNMFLLYQIFSCICFVIFLLRNHQYRMEAWKEHTWWCCSKVNIFIFPTAFTFCESEIYGTWGWSRSDL